MKKNCLLMNQIGRFTVNVSVLLLLAQIVSMPINVYAEEPTEASTPSKAPVTLSPTPLPSPDWNLDLTVSPVSLNIETEPGVPVTTTVKVKNNSVGPEYITIEIAKFTADETGAHPQLLDVSPSDEFVNWLSFSERSFVVKPGEWKSIDVTFSPPDYAALGYYMALIFNRNASITPGKRQTVISGAPAILLLADVNTPNARKELELVEFKSDKKFYEYLPVDFIVRVKNVGNIHVIPLGDIFIDKGSKKDVAVISINPGGGNILPNSERSYSVTWEDGFPVWKDKVRDGTVVHDPSGDVVKELSWNVKDANKFRFGKYTAHLLMVYDDGVRDVPLEAMLTFWVIPWKLISAVIVVLLLALTGFTVILKALAKKAKS